MRVKVADVGRYGTVVRKVGRVVPPLIDPVLVLRVLLTGDKALLELLAYAARLCELGNGFLCGFEFLCAEDGVDRLELIREVALPPASAFEPTLR